MADLHYLEEIEFDDSNPESRCACVLLLDVSASMSGAPIRQLNEGLVELQTALQADDLASMRVELAVVTFGGRVNLHQDFITANQLELEPVTTSGSTPMGEAINLGLDMIQRRKEIYRSNGVSYYRPWIFLITDGSPTDEWKTAAARVQEAEASKSVAFFAVGVQKANMNTLNQISTRQAVKLQGLHFQEMFVWLSESLRSVSHSQVGDQVPLAPPGWAEV
ncbi:MAG: VWA domain-containing protein [Chloroflexota bacterium]